LFQFFPAVYLRECDSGRIIEKWSTFTKVIVEKNKSSTFLWTTVYWCVDEDEGDVGDYSF